MVLDDFGYWEGCRNAWQEFRKKRGLEVDLTHVNGIGVYFQKPRAAAASGAGALQVTHP